MLTDACASCTPYCGGYAHWGMLQAAQWFVKNELQKVRGLLDERPGYELLLVGHSLGAGGSLLYSGLLFDCCQVSCSSSMVIKEITWTGQRLSMDERPAAAKTMPGVDVLDRCNLKAVSRTNCTAGTAAMLAHLLKNDPAAAKVMAGVKFSAVGVATPAVLTEKLAQDCSNYITSVVLQVGLECCWASLLSYGGMQGFVVCSALHQGGRTKRYHQKKMTQCCDCNEYIASAGLHASVSVHVQILLLGYSAS